MASGGLAKLECIKLGFLFMLEVGEINTKDHSRF